MHAVLGYQNLLTRLNAGEIFREGTWEERRLQGAKYNLRLASDLLVVPDRPSHPTGRVYPRGKHRRKEVILAPGDVAFVSTAERLAVPWDLVGLLGPKFSLTARGILTLTGSFVDPGFGLRAASESGDWRPKSDERLHFLLANVGPDSVALRPEKDEIATIAFLYTEEQPEKHEILSMGYLEIDHDHMSPVATAEAGLVYFRHMKRLEEQVQELNTYTESLEQRMATTESSTSQIVVFGIFLIAATFLGISVAILLSLLGSGKAADAVIVLEGLISQHTLGFAAAIALATGILWGIYRFCRLFLFRRSEASPGR